jgi:DNA-binding transcriptional ArsR family regulator
MKVDDATDEIAKVYEINSLEQLRAMADQLRLSILQRLLRRAMTVTQLGDALGIAPAKAHYHVRELERVGLLRLVQTREKGGILEKYYRAVAEDIQVPRSLLGNAPTDEALAALGKIFSLASSEFLAAAARDLRAGALGGEVQGLTHTSLWMSADEVRALTERMAELLKPYEQPRGVPGEREWTYFRTIHAVQVAERAPDMPDAPDAPDTPDAEQAPATAPAASGDAQHVTSAAPSPSNASTAGTTYYSRADLEWLVASGLAVDLVVPGACSFADDITPVLVERAIKSFHCRGPLSASPEVRQVLARKALRAPSS